MPGQNLTRVEAAERAALVRTGSYDVTLDLTTGEDTFRSTTTARSEPTGAYGGALVEQLAARPTLAAPQGTVYPLLSRLRQQGTVETTWQESPTGPPRRYYRLTPDGVRRLSAQRSTWQALTSDMAAVLRDPAGKDTQS